MFERLSCLQRMRARVPSFSRAPQKSSFNLWHFSSQGQKQILTQGISSLMTILGVLYRWLIKLLKMLTCPVLAADVPPIPNLWGKRESLDKRPH